MPPETFAAGEFGECCDDLKRAMTVPPNKLMRVDEYGVLFWSVGLAVTDEKNIWFDQAVIFCPFCGKQIQSREVVRQSARPN